MSKLVNVIYTYSDSYLKKKTKQELIEYIRTIEKNWINAVETNDIQYENCKRLLAEEGNKAVDTFSRELKECFNRETPSNIDENTAYFALDDVRMFIDVIAEQLKAGGK